MDIATKNTQIKNEKAEELFAYLDKGIDDMEAGRLHTVEEAFEIVGERIRNEI